MEKDDFDMAFKLQLKEITENLKSTDCEISKLQKQSNQYTQKIKHFRNLKKEIESKISILLNRKLKSQQIKAQLDPDNPFAKLQDFSTCKNSSQKAIKDKTQIKQINLHFAKINDLQKTKSPINKEKTQDFIARKNSAANTNILTKTKKVKLSEKTTDQTEKRLESVKELFGIESYRKNQLEAIRATLRGEDCFILMATGSGKSLCFQIPAAIEGGLTVVVSPLISLMNDQILQMDRIGLESRMLNSATSKEEAAEIFEDVQDANGALRILYFTPEKIKSSRLQSALKKCYQNNRLNRIVIDEAHCCSNWGFDFRYLPTLHFLKYLNIAPSKTRLFLKQRPDYFRLGQLRDLFPGSPIMALTATATKKVFQDVKRILKFRRCSVYSSSLDRPNIFYAVLRKPPIFEDAAKLLENVNS